MRSCVWLQWIFFWRLFQSICRFYGGWLRSAPAHTALSVQQFLTKTSMTPMSYSPYSPNLALSDFFCLLPQMKNTLKGKCFAIIEEVKQTNKNGRSTKNHQNQRVQKLFSAVERNIPLVYCITWRVLWRCLKFKHGRLNTQFFINKFWVFLVPPHI